MRSWKSDKMSQGEGEVTEKAPSVSSSDLEEVQILDGNGTTGDEGQV